MDGRTDGPIYRSRLARWKRTKGEINYSCAQVENNLATFLFNFYYCDTRALKFLKEFPASSHQVLPKEKVFNLGFSLLTTTGLYLPTFLFFYPFFLFRYFLFSPILDTSLKVSFLSFLLPFLWHKWLYFLSSYDSDVFLSIKQNQISCSVSSFSPGLRS